MEKSCVCVSCGLHHEAETNRKSTPELRKHKENPFSTRGREEFLALVAKVQEKKQKILKRSETDNELMVCFTHSDNKLKPVIIRAKSDIGQKSNNTTQAVEKAQEENPVEKVNMGVRELKWQQRCHDYLVVIVILASILLMFMEMLCQFCGAKD
uniref:Uncharacterized protein n=1 Tax=Chenopodium quinoa TaxID=63459 RepID=A0A803M2N3_CHEQI